MRLSPVALALISLALSAAPQSSAAHTPRQVDEYGAVTCEDEMARLDKYAVELQDDPSARAVVIVYGGRRGARRDEARARMAYAKHYLAVVRGVGRGRIVVLDGGFRESLTTELWVTPAGADAGRLINPTVPPKDVRVKKGKAGSRIRACCCIG